MCVDLVGPVYAGLSAGLPLFDFSGGVRLLRRSVNMTFGAEKRDEFDNLVTLFWKIRANEPTHTQEVGEEATNEIIVWWE